MEKKDWDSSLEDSDYDIFKREAVHLDVAQESGPSSEEPTPEKHKPNRKLKPTKRQLITLIAALLAVGCIGLGIFLAGQLTAKPKQQNTVIVNTQSLDNGTLNKLTVGTAGEVRQQLTISPDTIFKNNVTIQGSAEIKHDLVVDGNLTTKGKANVQGPVNLGDSLTVTKALIVSGNTALASNLSVSGEISAATLTVGSLTINSINLSNSLVFGGHLVPNGTAPAGRVSTASANGSVRVTGNDTAGTVTIVIGNGQLVSGEMAIITFRNAFNLTPKVQLTAINEASANLRFYATRSASFFTVDTATPPAAGQTYVFDYLVTQ